MNAEQTLDNKAERPPKPGLVFRVCDWCEGTGKVGIEGYDQVCAECGGVGGWHVDASDPNVETAGADWLCLLALVGLLVLTWAG